jgi:hypothetical protein
MSQAQGHSTSSKKRVIKEESLHQRRESSKKRVFIKEERFLANRMSQAQGHSKIRGVAHTHTRTKTKTKMETKTLIRTRRHAKMATLQMKGNFADEGLYSGAMRQCMRFVHDICILPASSIPPPCPLFPHITPDLCNRNTLCRGTLLPSTSFPRTRIARN